MTSRPSHLIQATSLHASVLLACRSLPRHLPPDQSIFHGAVCSGTITCFAPEAPNGDSTTGCYQVGEQRTEYKGGQH